MQNRTFHKFLPQSFTQSPSAFTTLGNHLYQLGAGLTSYAAKMVSPILASIEHYTIGDLRAYLRDPSHYHSQLLAKARANPNGFASAYFGPLVGNIAIWQPKLHDQEALSTFLNTIDKKTNGRNVHRPFKFFSGSDTFLVANTQPNARVHRQLLAGHLVPSRYDKKTVCGTVDEVLLQFSLQENKKPVKLRETMSHIVHKILGKTILGIDSLPENTYAIMRSFEQDIKENIGSPFPSLFYLSPTLRKKRDLYKNFANTVLEGQLQSILRDLKEESSPGNKNLVLGFLIHLIKEKHPELSKDKNKLCEYLKNISEKEIQSYFKNDAMKMLPMLLRPSDGLIDALTICLSQLVEQPELLQKLRDEIQSVYLFEGDKEVDYHLLMNQMPLLDAYYKETLRFESINTIPRYTQDKIQCGSVEIPAKTTLLIDFEGLRRGKFVGAHPDTFLPSRFFSEKKENSLEFNKLPVIPFSVGERKCPAIHVSPRIFKLALSYIVSHFDLIPVKDENMETIISFKPNSPIALPAQLNKIK